jgi:hypothetical protein
MCPRKLRSDDAMLNGALSISRVSMSLGPIINLPINVPQTSPSHAQQ